MLMNERDKEKIKLDITELKKQMGTYETKILDRMMSLVFKEIGKIQRAQAKLYHEIENMREEQKELHAENMELRDQLRKLQN